MGQTLSHGVYLPNEGERNCYAGLASNWQILNTAVGNIAEKAPLVHTHGNITNDGKVGTTANLPLITGTGGAITAGAFGNQANTFCEGNDSRLSDARTPVAHTHGKSDVTDLLNSNFIPSANNSYDLGSSSYQWNNLYAKKTYTSLIKAATGDLIIQSNGTNKSVAIYNGTLVGDGGGIWLYGKDHANGSKVRLQIYNTTTSGYEGVDLSNSSLYPAPNTLLNLGTSTNKWKTFNGINPGALGLPSGNYDPIDTDGWDLTGATNQAYTPTVNGWLFISIQNIAGNYLSIVSGRGAISIDGTGAQSGLRAMLPVIANESVVITVKTGAIFAARFYPMQGNVS